MGLDIILAINVLQEIEDTTPMVGAKVVARAWVDPDFKQRTQFGA